MSSPFLAIPESEWVASNALAFAIRDRYPVSRGHTLVIPRRLVATWFEATAAEQQAVFALVDEVKRRLDTELKPDGYNVGFNVGAAAGQTVFHLHVHVIPRFQGDMADPRGGVRHVIPGKGNYLATAAKPLSTGGAEDPFLRHLKPLFERARDVAILAAFVQDSGLELLHGSVEEALARGARVRILTGDYLAITQAVALRRLLDWMEESQAGREDEEDRGLFEARVVEVERLGLSSFHPKSWRFLGEGLAVAFVGSSNISRTALDRGIEWNLRVECDRDPRAWQGVVEAFEGWWERARPLQSEWVAEYAARAKRANPALPPGEQEVEPPPPRREPHSVQREAVTALARSRAEGHSRALVVLATGLGKTLLAVLDVEAVRAEWGRIPRVLLLAHRAELLAQAAETFRRQLPDTRFGWFIGERSELDGDVVLASVQKLSRPEHLARLKAAPPFDYVIVDEVHHADAASYRAILGRLSPAFLLGLTATPERTDEGDVLGLFGDHVAYRADVGEGIARGLLVPFEYRGLKDDIAYENIPWRNRRFDPEALAAAVQTEGRMQRMWKAWEEHPARRSLVFCCSVSHATYVRKWLGAQGVRVEEVHSGPGSAERTEALRKLTAGELDALCTVDLFNEGVDVPLVDRVVMLRPTESPVVFLQQLGRGLRQAPGKLKVSIIDFVGNHRVFLDRVRTLLALGQRPLSLRDFLERGQEPELPPGCFVQVELEVKELLAKLLPSGRAEVERVFRELRNMRGQRPTAGELFRMGYRPETLREAHGGWFGFVEQEGALSPDEVRALAAGREWFQELETTSMSKSFKMVLLEALLEADALEQGLAESELCDRSLEILRRSPELMKDLEGVNALDDPRDPSPRSFRAYWRANPIKAWTQGPQGRWFRLDGDRFVSKLPIPEGAENAFQALIYELLDYRLARYRAREEGTGAQGAAFEAPVTWNKRDPILKVPSRATRPDVPSGELDVRLPDGSLWRFRMMKEFCNVARPVGVDRNQLPDLLRCWFGPRAGHPGTAFRVRFTPRAGGWWVEPVQAAVIPLARRGTLVAFPSLRAAAGAASHTVALESAPEADRVRLPVSAQGEGLFAVRASGDSMEGGERPIRDGDWLVMRYARGAGAGAVEGKVALVQVPEPAGFAYQVKRIVREQDRWLLRSDNPARPSFEAAENVVPIALLVEVIAPEQLGPERGAQLTDEQAMEAFGLDRPPKTGRRDSHLFLCVTEQGVLVEPDQIALRLGDRRPAETAFVLTRAAPQDPWRYGGVARWQESEDRWALTEPVDYATWRALGHGRTSSRRLPPKAVTRAEAWVEQLLRNHPPGTLLERHGKHCRLVGKSPRGGVRIDGGSGGFAERTVSQTDLAWALMARDDVQKTGGLLDEARVNRLRYLEGTPEESTRWIDTGWALFLIAAATP